MRRNLSGTIIESIRQETGFASPIDVESPREERPIMFDNGCKCTLYGQLAR